MLHVTRRVRFEFVNAQRNAFQIAGEMRQLRIRRYLDKVLMHQRLELRVDTDGGHSERLSDLQLTQQSCVSDRNDANQPCNFLRQQRQARVVSVPAHAETDVIGG